MEEKSIEHQLRRFLLGVAAFILIGTIAELLLIEHYEEGLQWLPFIFSVVGLLSIGGVWLYPTTKALKAMRVIMGLVVLSGVVGIYIHFSRNLAFTREINPSFSLAESILPALKGSYPLLAPGILFLAGILALAAAHRHPKLEKS